MSIADDLAKLEQLRNSGSLTQAEFDEAKHALLHPSTINPPPSAASATSAPDASEIYGTVHRYGDDDSLGRAANRYVDYRIVTGVIGGIVALIVFLIVLSNMGSSGNGVDNPGIGPTIVCTGDPAEC